MITGDQRPTAVAIGKLIGLLDKDASDDVCKIKARACKELHADTTPKPSPKADKLSRKLSVHDIKSDSDSHEKEYKDTEEINQMVEECNIWSRAQPSDKVCIVDSLKAQGHICAMTGDGVNDAPAIKSADIGVAMGISGTMVTKTAADMILMDDNFTTIVAAVREGRKIYGNVQKYIVFNFSVKGSECLCFLTAIACGFPMPMKGLQQLVNLFVTHIIPPIALAWEEVEEYTMRIPPRDTRHDLVVNRRLMLFRWLPFVCGYAVIVMSIFSFSLYQETGFLQASALVGSSARGALEEKRVACRVGGYLDEAGDFIEDAEPYHCDCPGYAGGPKDDQWGRLDASKYPINPWNGDIGNEFDKENTPFAGDGEKRLIKWCTDRKGVERACWSDPEAPRPKLDSSTNCATYGARNSQSVAYVMMHLGEILFLATCRRDSHLFSPPVFSKAYAIVLTFNLTCLVCLIYVPPITAFFGLLPLTPVRLALALLGPLLIVIWNEIVKVEYRRRLHMEHGDAMYAPSPSPDGP
jgi:magnesium-transporting ATPase (P-type)